MNRIPLRRRLVRRLPTLLITLAAILFAAPFYVSFIYSVKTKSQITFTGLAFPTEFHWDNYTRAIEQSNFFHAMWNSFVTTLPTVLILLVICPMAAYVLGRNNSRFYNIMYTKLSEISDNFVY